MLLIIDNYDSFTYNLVQAMGSLHADIKVVRNDEISTPEIQALAPTHIIISPGPGHPMDAGICEDVIHAMADRSAILGVCLGHQGICEVYGAIIGRARRLMHGKQSHISIDNSQSIFRGLPETIKAARYHSLAALKESIPSTLKVIAADEKGEVMAVRHRSHRTFGLQFHPESILTPLGHQILANFLLEGGGVNDSSSN